MTAQERLAVGARHQLGDLRREEPRQLGALAVDRPQVVPLQVAQALRGQGGREPGLEDGRVERLRQVVGRAHLDAADDAVQLVDGRDHDDRQVAGGVGGLDPAEGLVAVHLGHLEVQQDDVDARGVLRLQEVHGQPAVLGLDHLVTLCLQARARMIRLSRVSSTTRMRPRSSLTTPRPGHRGAQGRIHRAVGRRGLVHPDVQPGDVPRGGRGLDLAALRRQAQRPEARAGRFERMRGPPGGRCIAGDHRGAEIGEEARAVGSVGVHELGQERAVAPDRLEQVGQRRGIDGFFRHRDLRCDVEGGGTVAAGRLDGAAARAAARASGRIGLET